MENLHLAEIQKIIGKKLEQNPKSINLFVK